MTVNPISNRARPPRVGVLGATLGTGNLGVDALGISMVQGLVAALPDIEIVYQAWDLDKPVNIPLGERSFSCQPVAIRRKGSIRHRDGLLQIKKRAKLRRWLSARSIPSLPIFSSALKHLLSCDAILDISAGDSFSDIYGPRVFWYQAQIKLLCLELGIPLVLMPQTFGPFSEESSREVAASIFSRVDLVCTREAEGVAEIQALCGESPPPRMVCVPDMAFLLEPRELELPARFQRGKSEGAVCIALNISGLLYFAKQSFGLSIDFPKLCQHFLRWALSIPESRVLLVPHVVAPTLFPGIKNPRIASSDTTDTIACEQIYSSLAPSSAARVDLLSPPQDPSQAKFAISQCDYFLGARMHAFIGAASQGVPGSLLAYSKKANGLASLLGIGDSVIDLRKSTIEACVAAVDAQFQRRQATQKHLQERVPQAKAELNRFFSQEIAPLILGPRHTLPDPHFQQKKDGQQKKDDAKMRHSEVQR